MGIEALAVSLIIAAINGLPKVIEAIQTSKTLSAEEKAKLLAELHERLRAADVRVAGVKFKTFDDDEPEAVAPSSSPAPSDG